MSTYTYFQSSIRNNYVLRAFLLPFIKMKRTADLYKYQNSEEVQYIKGLKNSCQGEKCFIIGNGPSLKREDLDLLKNEKTFAFNRIYSMYPYTDWRPTYYMIIDKAIIHTMNHENEKELGAGYIFVADRRLAQKYKDQNAHQIGKEVSVPIHIYKRVPIKNIKEDVSQCFSFPQSVTITAFELAFYMGFKEIYLLGVDHSFAVEIDASGKKHTNKGIESHFKEDNDKSLYASCIDALTKEFETCKRYADQHGVKVVNVTRGGKLEVFERDSLENVLEQC